jgi:hypothetical protein
MLVSVELPLFHKPGDLLEEGRPVTSAELRTLARDLHHTVLNAARVLDILTAQGWKNTMCLYSIDLEPPVELSTVEEAEQLFQRLGVNPDHVALFVDEDDDDDLDETAPAA